MVRPGPAARCCGGLGGSGAAVAAALESGEYGWLRHMRRLDRALAGAK
jgi:homoserine kinase